MSYPMTESSSQQVHSKELISDTGGTGHIYRLTYMDRSTAIEKSAKTLTSNKAIADEHKVLTLLGEMPYCPDGIPRVLGPLVTDPATTIYSFLMSDIQGRPLSELTERDNTEFLNSSYFNRINALLVAALPLAFANKFGYVHNDVQLRNILFKSNPSTGGVVDWELCVPLTASNQFSDVAAFAGLISKIFRKKYAPDDIFPIGVDTWRGGVEAKRYPDVEHAWDQLFKLVSLDIPKD